MTDITPWAVDLSFADLDSTGFKGVLGGLFGGGKGVDAVAALAPAGEVFKQVPLYGANAPLPLKKTLSITRSTDFEVSRGSYCTYSTCGRRLRSGRFFFSFLWSGRFEVVGVLGVVVRSSYSRGSCIINGIIELVY